jgi:hypothetical protein
VARTSSSRARAAFGDDVGRIGDRWRHLRDLGLAGIDGILDDR